MKNQNSKSYFAKGVVRIMFRRASEQTRWDEMFQDSATENKYRSGGFFGTAHAQGEKIGH